MNTLTPKCIVKDIQKEWFDTALDILKETHNCWEWYTYLYGA